ITVPLEADLLQGVAFLDEIHSESVAGLSSIVMYFEEGTDIFKARQVVAERLTQAHALPHVSKPPQMLQPLSSSSRLLMFSMASSDVSLIDMSILAKWTVRPRLVGVPGVANVAIFGMRERQLQVRVDPERMRSEGVGLQAVIEATGNALAVSPLTYLDASTPGTGGFIDTPNQRLGVQHVFPIRTADDLAQIRIPPEFTDGSTVRLGDVANVVEDHQLLIGDAVVNDGEGLVLVVEKFPNADTATVTRDVEAALHALQPGLPGITLDTSIYRPATFLDSAIGNVSIALIAGLVLAAAVMFVFFRSWRAGLIGLVSLPLSLVAALLVLDRFGATLNAIVVAGLVLALSIVIDDAIVGVDEILRRGRHPRDVDSGQSAAWIILEAVVHRRRAIVFATLVLFAAMAPLFFTNGVAGAFLPPLLIAYILAIATSAVVALIVTPALAAVLLSGAPREQHQTATSRRLHNSYAGLLSKVLGRTRPVFAAAAAITIVVIVVTAAVSVPHLGDAFVPSFREGDILINVEGPPSASGAEMNRIVARAGAEIRAVEGVRNVGGHVGRAITSDQVTNVNTGELWVSIDPAADYDRTMSEIAAIVAGYPGLRHSVGTYTSARIDDVLAGPENDVGVRVYGHEDDVILAKANEVRDALAGVGGLTDLNVNAPTQEPRLRVEVDLEAAGRLGVAPGDVRRAAATLLAGIEVGFLFEDQKVFEVVVWGVPDLRYSLSSMRGIPIPTGSGEVRLDQVADVSIQAGPVAIQREGVFRFVDVVGSVNGRDLASVMADVEDRVAGVTFPLEYRAEVLAGSLERQAELTGLLIMAAASAILILLLLQAAFNSWRRALYIYVALPTALVGAALGAIVAGGVVSIGVVAGMLGVLALAARNGLVMVDRYQELEQDPDAVLKPELILDGARERLAPILATATATFLAFAPFIVLGGLPGLEILRPMAIVMVGGVATSTLFTLFLVPAVYFRSGPSPEPDAASQLVEQPGLSPA
ncbi:MAG TPA: efflux RND transporter permease subunit, partial [Candidatus Limnocylindrales bacterium]|nr:efflux RND transporter permease subunit [Candidatus Limnocylindrales bacterium]